MAYTIKKYWVDYAIYGLSVFLLFCLVFESYIELPVVLAWLGRWHPLVLHFPIVLLIGMIFLGLTGKTIPRNLLLLTALVTLITAISGFFLGKEVVAKGDLLVKHQWLGGAVAFLTVGWYYLEGTQWSKTIYVKGLQIVLFGFIGFTGHFGGMVTHGEYFLALPQNTRQTKIPENPLIYQHVVARILKNKCTSCHNPNKQKGEFLVSSLADLLKGGEVGNTVVPGDVEKSELIKRLHLPISDEEHMPPEGKKPLEDIEIKILERWIALGASDTLRLNHLLTSEPLVGLIKDLMQPNSSEKWAQLPKVADSTLLSLTSDYLTINRVANSTNALVVSAFLAPKYNTQFIEELRRVSKNIVQLDLSGLPIGKLELGFAAQCANLEWLEIDRTPITDTEMDTLQNLTKLSLLKIHHTPITDKSLAVLNKIKSLKKLYLWETKISKRGIDELKSSNPTLIINNGIDYEINRFFIEKDSLL